ncbi:hypothetical protein J2Z83_000079 [Virgibacillus natechei]|uniref:Degradation enzyme regulation protein DegQ n=1 Tax=Virgibacillus natechei TaxID=1216297 RepID=A0ABS4IAN4_9BACI|nr:hypothetical protein [Virgibacillus natechei]MBP1967987.1 hypothetical protein [Virgibacillus natechei]UZD14727.1 hypothetical protein OLD84_09595 [Virgibacillus natechei]
MSIERLEDKMDRLIEKHEETMKRFDEVVSRTDSILEEMKYQSRLYRKKEGIEYR